MPAAVIPAPLAYIKAAAVKTLVVVVALGGTIVCESARLSLLAMLWDDC